MFRKNQNHNIILKPLFYKRLCSYYGIQIRSQISLSVVGSEPALSTWISIRFYRLYIYLLHGERLRITPFSCYDPHVILTLSWYIYFIFVQFRTGSIVQMMKTTEAYFGMKLWQEVPVPNIALVAQRQVKHVHSFSPVTY